LQQEETGMNKTPVVGTHNRHAKFEIFTTTPLNVGEQVFISGSCSTLGSWRPDGFPLTRSDDNLWTGIVEIPSNEKIEFKITRGTWASEEVLPSGRIAYNYVIQPRDDGRISHRIYTWKDKQQAPAPVITGNYRIHEGFHSKYLRFDRRVIVWLPPFYEQNPDHRYPVLYMQDGQQVFDPRTSTWNQDLEVDEHCEQMILNGQLQEVIVVGIYSTEDRYLEYHPALAGGEYARFLITELKPFIDSHYRTKPDRDSTAIAGASMGGSIAFYLAWTRPDIFFGAACLSPAFRFRDDSSIPEMVRQAQSLPDVKIYLYCGEGDATERELMEGMREMEKMLKKKGYGPHQLKVQAEAKAVHREAAWARYTPEWLTFLFGR
jgi:predicted alpha/beta superfamily hydrolase